MMFLKNSYKQAKFNNVLRIKVLCLVENETKVKTGGKNLVKFDLYKLGNDTKSTVFYTFSYVVRVIVVSCLNLCMQDCIMGIVLYMTVHKCECLCCKMYLSGCGLSLINK